MNINNEILGLFKQICILDEEDLSSFLFNFLIDRYGENNVIEANDYILAKGTIPIALCAHMDTVGIMPPKQIYYDAEEAVMWSPDLLGADDRAGIFAIIWLILNGLRPMIIFTAEEEVGGLGAKTLVKDYSKSPFGKIKFIIELDRRGSKDAVYYFCNNPTFEQKISEFGFKTAYGTFTDISVIAPEWGCAAVNLSVGYYDEHTVGEHLNFNELITTINKVKNILTKEKELSYYDYIPMKFNYSYFKRESQSPRCGICNRAFNKKEKIYPAYGLQVCGKCYEEYCV